MSSAYNNSPAFFLIAQTVVSELLPVWGIAVPAGFAERLAGRLALRAQKTCAANPVFRRRILGAAGDAGRDRLYRYMRHWAASLIRRSPELSVPADKLRETAGWRR